MAKKKRVTRKQLLKEPDKVITTTNRLLQLFQDYQKQCTISVAAILVIICLVLAVRHFSEQKDRAAFAAFDKASEKYSELLSTKGAEEALTEVQAIFEALFAEYPGRKATQLARLFYANICYRANAVDKAIEEYGLAVMDFKDRPDLKSLAMKGLAGSYERKGESEKAIDIYREITVEDGTLNKDEALFHLGRLQAVAGDKQASLETYRKLVDEYPQSMYLDLARAKTDKL